MVFVCLLRQQSGCGLLGCVEDFCGGPEMSNKLQLKKTPENMKPRQQNKRDVEYVTVEKAQQR